MRAQAQLSRLLRLVPYLAAHQGIEVAAVALAFDTTEKQIINDLEVLQFCGLPGGYWDDLFDVDIETVRNEGHIEFRNADVLSRPLQLRPDEAASLLAAMQLVVDVAGTSDAASSALAKLRAAVGHEAERVSVAVAPTDPGQRAALAAAIDARRVVQVEYLTSGRSGTSIASVEPVELRLVDGYPYLEAWSRLRGAWRSFRLDRLVSVTVTDESYTPREDPRPAWFDGARELTLTVTPAAAWIAEYYPTTRVAALEGGLLSITFPVASSAWASALLLRLGDDVVDVSDPDARAAAADRARRALDAFRSVLG